MIQNKPRAKIPVRQTTAAQLTVIQNPFLMCFSMANNLAPHPADS